MDWSSERYVRVYTRDTTDYSAWSWEAQALWWLLLRKFDRAGILDLGRHGKKGVCQHIKMPWTLAAPALDEILADGCLELDEDRRRLVCRNYVEAQEAPASGALRTAAWREKKKAEGDKSSPDVTNRRLDVTIGDGRDESDSVPCRAVPSVPISAPKAPRAARASKKPAPTPTDPMPFLVSDLMEALAKGSKGMVAISPCLTGHAVQITARIRELHEAQVTLDDIALAGEYVAARWSRDLDLGPAWVATEGKLADTVAKARRWREAGRPPRGSNGSAGSSPPAGRDFTAERLEREAREAAAKGDPEAIRWLEAHGVRTADA